MNPPDMDFSADLEPPIDLDDYDSTPGDGATPSAPPKEARPKESRPIYGK